MALFVSFVAAFLLLVTILFYVFIYTIWLKRSTMQNIVIGGAAGAFPPMIGWAAVTGNISFESFSLFLLASWSLFRSSGRSLPLSQVSQSHLSQVGSHSLLLLRASI